MIGLPNGRLGAITSTAAAVIIAALMISVSIFYVGLGGARTETVTTTVAPSSIQLHKVTFNDTGLYCNGVSYVSPWAVTLGKITIAQPSNATLPLSGAYSESSAYYLISKIVFTVPNGSYNYTVIPSELMPASGTVNVNGSDSIVELFQIGRH